MKSIAITLASVLLIGMPLGTNGAPPPKPGPAAPAADTKHCGKETAHPAHRWGGKSGHAFFCPGGPDPRPPGAPDPKPRR